MLSMYTSLPVFVVVSTRALQQSLITEPVSRLLELLLYSE
jgi:hypothetical protein